VADFEKKAKLKNRTVSAVKRSLNGKRNRNGGGKRFDGEVEEKEPSHF
jgi:hypothetical protein